MVAVRSFSRSAPIAPKKMRIILDEVRGKRVDEAMAILRFMPTPHARMVAKAVRSAAANAENNYNMDPRNLRVTQAFVGDGEKLRRMMPACPRPRRHHASPPEQHHDHRGRGRLMGQKVHPHGFRLGYIYDWNSKWFADRNYTELLHEDLSIRKAIMKMLPDAGISRVEIERNANQITVSIHTARPGIVIGRGGQRVDELRTKPREGQRAARCA